MIGAIGDRYSIRSLFDVWCTYEIVGFERMGFFDFKSDCYMPEEDAWRLKCLEGPAAMFDATIILDRALGDAKISRKLEVVE